MLLFILDVCGVDEKEKKEKINIFTHTILVRNRIADGNYVLFSMCSATNLNSLTL